MFRLLDGFLIAAIVALAVYLSRAEMNIGYLEKQVRDLTARLDFEETQRQIDLSDFE